MDAIRIYPQDNVAVALRDLNKGETVQIDGQAINVLQNIPNGHKIVLSPIAKGEPAIKYGNSIGIVT